MRLGNDGIAGEMRPTLTSVDIDGVRIAREVIAIILRRLEGSFVQPRSVDVCYRLIARESA